MTQTSNFRDRAHAVRTSAREALLQLREERMAMRRDLAATRDIAGAARVSGRRHSALHNDETGPDLTIPDSPLPSIFGHTRLAESGTSPVDVATAAEDLSSADGIVASEEANHVVDAPVEQETTVANAPMTGEETWCDGSVGPEEGDHLVDTHDVTGTTGVSRNCDSTDRSADHDFMQAGDAADVTASSAGAQETETDLSRLPGAGAGLVWMLQQCGITTLADLATAEADALSVRLGVIGQIVNVQTWIDFAKADLAA